MFQLNFFSLFYNDKIWRILRVFWRLILKVRRSIPMSYLQLQYLFDGYQCQFPITSGFWFVDTAIQYIKPWPENIMVLKRQPFTVTSKKHMTNRKLCACWSRETSFFWLLLPRLATFHCCIQRCRASLASLKAENPTISKHRFSYGRLYFTCPSKAKYGPFGISRTHWSLNLKPSISLAHSCRM